jgi:hypothetical protein
VPPQGGNVPFTKCAWHRAARNEGRHAGKIGFRTQIGNDWFSWFGTRTSKNGLNFPDHRTESGGKPLTRPMTWPAVTCEGITCRRRR